MSVTFACRVCVGHDRGIRDFYDRDRESCSWRSFRLELDSVAMKVTSPDSPGTATSTPVSANFTIRDLPKKSAGSGGAGELDILHAQFDCGTVRPPDIAGYSAITHRDGANQPAHTAQ